MKKVIKNENGYCVASLNVLDDVKYKSCVSAQAFCDGYQYYNFTGKTMIPVKVEDGYCVAEATPVTDSFRTRAEAEAVLPYIAE